MILQKKKLIFIHIPKTGGSSFEAYLTRKHNNKERLTKDNLYSTKREAHNGHSLQHCTYKELQTLVSDINQYRIITFVRNPFHRLLSELLYTKRVTRTTSPAMVHKIVNDLFTNHTPNLIQRKYENYDNHLVPQIDFIVDDNDQIPCNVTIVNTHDLDSVLPKLGFIDFKEHANKSFNREYFNYDTFFDQDTRRLIRNYYARDFAMLFDENGNYHT
jgi:hypothetical protein